MALRAVSMLEYNGILRGTLCLNTAIIRDLGACNIFKYTLLNTSA